ncbi:hypothetical protein BG004_000327 [Podila humilis]|nr:hypothetical protein BG004_000327 [Podila humilis]
MSMETITLDSRCINNTNNNIHYFPAEVLGVVQDYLDCPIDLLHYSHACRRFYRIVDGLAWFKLYRTQLPRWSIRVQFDNLCNPSDWKVLVLEDYLKKQGPWSARSTNEAHNDVSSSNTNGFVHMQTIEHSTTAAPRTEILLPDALHISHQTTSSVAIPPARTGSAQPPLYAIDSATPLTFLSLPPENILETADIRLYINLEDAEHIRPRNMLPGGWQNIGPPVSSTDHASGRTLAAYIQSHSYGAETDYQIVIYCLPDHDTPIATLSSDYWSTTFPGYVHHHHYQQEHQPQVNPLEEMGRGSSMAQIMYITYFPEMRDGQNRARCLIALAFGQGSGPLSDINENNNVLDVWMNIRVIECYIPDALPSSTLPEHVSAYRHPHEQYHHHQHQHQQQHQQHHMPRLVNARLDPARGRVENIVPIHGMSPTNMLRGRMIKLYTIKDPLTGVCKDYIALFGILHDSSGSTLIAPAVVIKGELFESSCHQNQWSYSVTPTIVRASASCMALFPPHSGFEQLMVVFYPNGEGEIWNWLNMKLIMRLSTRLQTEMDLEEDGQAKQSHYPSTGTLSITTTTSPTSATASSAADQTLSARNPYTASSANEKNNLGRDEKQRNIVQLYCWGVHVVPAVELPGGQPFGDITNRSNPNRSDFRVLTMADGSGKEWESSFWHVQGAVLQRCLGAQEVESEWLSSTFIWPSSTLSTTIEDSAHTSVPVVGCSGRHYESWTLGGAVISKPAQHTTPSTLSTTTTENDQSRLRPENHLLFIAFLVWDHYRISLTSQYGLCLVDLDQELVGDYQGEDLAKKMTLTQNKQLVTFLEEENTVNNDPLVDIATVGSALFITRKRSHMIWRLRRRLCISQETVCP